MSITASMVKELRDKTGAGMMDCKTALTEAGGDLEAAVDWLRTKGLAKAAKKAGRVAAEGLIGIASKDNKAAIVEVNSETDFVSRNETFQDLVRTIAETALTVDGDVEALAAATYPGKAQSVADELQEAIATIGENMSLRRSAAFTADPGAVATYMHNAVAPGLGKIGVLVSLESSGDPAVLMAIGKQIAMHVAATNPIAVTEDAIPADVVERERAVYFEQARESGKPDNIIEKMVEGRLRKYFEEVALVKQAFVVDPDKTVEQALKAAESEAGAPIAIAGFVRYALGEGIEKEESDFAAEVAAATGGS